MENWGIVTFRETRLLYDDRNNSVIDKRNVVNVICHELAHMWFGNLGNLIFTINNTIPSNENMKYIFFFLVTLSWWNDLWLNEGFATYMSYKSADEILPNQKYVRLVIAI